MQRKRYFGSGELIPVKEPIIGKNYHVKWASKGVVGICFQIDNKAKTVKLKSPKSGKVWNCIVNWDDLLHTRKNQVTNPH